MNDIMTSRDNIRTHIIMANIVKSVLGKCNSVSVLMGDDNRLQRLWPLHGFLIQLCFRGTDRLNGYGH